jgi:hypothetical protein
VKIQGGIAMDVKLLVTNEFNGQITGTAHAKSQDIPFATDGLNLKTIPPCDFITARPLPMGNSSKVSFQIQNFGSYAVLVFTGNLKDYVLSGGKKIIIYPNQLGEFKLDRDEDIKIVPYLPPPSGFQAKLEKQRMILLKWNKIPEAIGYRISKVIWIKKKSDNNWSLYQHWFVDTSLDYLYDSDIGFENFEGYDDDTVYGVNALGIGNNQGYDSYTITLRMIRESQPDWVLARPPPSVNQRKS